MDMIANLMTNVPDILAAAGTVCVACTAVTALTPTQSDDKIINFVLKILNLLSGNIGKNRNKDDQ